MLTHHAACRPEGRDEVAQNDEAGVGHELRDLPDAADILDAIDVGEAEILVKSVADIVAVEQESVPSQAVQPLLDQIGYGRFASAGEAGEPQHARTLILEAGMRRPIRSEEHTSELQSLMLISYAV